jgi:hypothetical protein
MKIKKSVEFEIQTALAPDDDYVKELTWDEFQAAVGRMADAVDTAKGDFGATDVRVSIEYTTMKATWTEEV